MLWRRDSARAWACCWCWCCMLLSAGSARSALERKAALQLAQDFFAMRGLSVVTAVLSEERDRRTVLGALSRDGRFVVSMLQNMTVASAPLGVLLLEHCSPELVRGRLNSSFHWLLVGQEVDTDHLDLRMDSELTVAQLRHGSHTNSVLEEVFRVGPGLPVQRRELPLPSPLQPAGPSSVHRRNRAGACCIHVRNSVFLENGVVSQPVLDNLINMPREEVLKHANLLSAYGHSVFMNLVTMFNMTISMSSVNFTGELNLRPNGYFSGAAGEVQAGRADVTSTGLLFTADRLSTFKFTVPVWKLRNMCLFLSDGQLGSIDSLVVPFHWSVWLTAVVLALLYLLLNRIFCSAGRNSVSWSEAFLVTISSLTGQGFFGPTTWISNCILFLSIETFFLLANNFYSSTIVKFLLSTPASSVRSVRDILPSKYHGVALDWFHTKRIFKNATDSLLRDIYEKKIKTPFGKGFVPHQVANVALKSPMTMLFGSERITDSISSLTNREVCRLQEMDVQPAGVISPAIAKSASFKDLLCSGELILVERGIASRELTTWNPHRSQCNSDGALHETEAVSLVPMLPVIVVLLSGVLVSGLVCLLEIVRASWNLEDEESSSILRHEQRQRRSATPTDATIRA